MYVSLSILLQILVPGFVSWCFMSTETIRLIRDGEPRTTTSTFIQLVSSAVSVSQYLFFHKYSDVVIM